MGYYPILDRAPKGRDEGDDDWQTWIRRHDQYAASDAQRTQRGGAARNQARSGFSGLIRNFAGRHAHA